MFTIVMCTYTDLVCASKLDNYKDLIRSREFTISYTYETEIPTLFNFNPEANHIENRIYFEEYRTAAKYYANKLCIPNMTQLTAEDTIKNSGGKEYLFSNNGRNGAWLRSITLPEGSKGIAVVSKDNMFSECIADTQSIHHLKLGNQYIGWKSYKADTRLNPQYTPVGDSIVNGRGVSIASAVPLGGLFSIFGGGDNTISLKYMPYDTEMELNYGINLGSTLITRYVNAILPDEEHAVYVPSFKLVNATSEYEDYQINNGGKKEVVRYCFDGDKLTQIMAVVAGYKIDGTPDVHQYKIIINQFDNQVDTKYFEVPEYIKVKK